MDHYTAKSTKGSAGHTNGLFEAQASNRVDDITPSRQLSVDSLLLYIQTRLRGLDGDIKKILGQQKSSVELRKVLGEARAAIDGAGSKGDGGKNLISSVTVNIDAAIDLAKSRGDTAMVSQLQDIRTVVHNAGDDIFNPEERVEVGEKLKSLEDGLSGNAELDMIEVQSLMGQRSTSVQLATSMLASMNESFKAIVQNTRG